MGPVFSLDTRTVPGSVIGRDAHGKVLLDWVDIAPGTAHTLPEGMRLEDYEIVGPIGEGGFGIVYLAWDHALEQHVAIKEYLPAILASRASVSPAVVVKSQRHKDDFCLGMRSFLNEARILARFDHPSLVRVLHFWEGNGTAYMAMPYYEGPTLARALSELGHPPDEVELCAWLHPLLDALGTMHAASCFHRDIAPDNILLTDHGPVLLDFGAARRVIEGVGPSPTVVFKPGFAPIEQYGEVASMKQGPWTDLYALASVVYTAVTGQPPAPSIERLMDDRLQPLSKVACGRYSEAFLAAIDAALSLHPRDRPQSAAEFWTLLSCGQQLQDLDLLRAVRGIDSQSGPDLPPLVGDLPSDPTMPLDEDLDSFFEAPVPEPAPEPVADPSENDAPVTGDLVEPTLMPIEHSGPPVSPAADPGPRSSSRIKIAGLFIAIGCIGLAVLGYDQFSGRIEAEPVVGAIAPSTPPVAIAVPPPSVSPAVIAAPTPAQTSPSEVMSATEALSLPEQDRAKTVETPPTPEATSEPLVATPPPSLSDAEVAPAGATPARISAPAPVSPEPVRKAVARAPAVAARPLRREARTPAIGSQVLPAGVEVVPVEVPQLPQKPQMQTKCTDILQRASLGPVTAEETAILRRGCE